MVCPYRLVTGFITASLSIFYLTSTAADAQDGFGGKKEEQSKKKPLNPLPRMLLISALIIFHVDLFTTGYLRMGVKHVLQNLQAA